VGSFYTNITVRSPQPARVADVLKSAGREAFVSPAANGCTVVFDLECEDQDIDVLNQLASALSGKLGCPALAVLNHDDDVLVVTLHEGGRLVDEYNSSPEYFTDGPGAAPEGGDAERICHAFGADGKVDEVEAVLRTQGHSDGGFAFEMERHESLVKALGLPPAAVATGFNYIDQGELPEGLSESDFVRTG
jgi:hypothetical protein